jgi:site-specific DNA-methyltransferase (adenine-specific)
MKPYFERNGVTLYHGDCEAVLPTLADGRFPLVFTSPPYNMGIGAGGGAENGRLYAVSRSSKGRRFRDGYEQQGDAMPWEEYVAWQQRVLLDCWRVTAAGGALFYNHRPRLFHHQAWLPTALNPGLPLRQVVIWDKGTGVGVGDGHYAWLCEWLLVFARPSFKLRSHADSGVGDVWRIPHLAGKNYGHPAPFPAALPMQALRTTGAASVLDPFVGTGSTLVAAQAMGREAVGVEINERYCEIAARRLEQAPLPLFA